MNFNNKYLGLLLSFPLALSLFQLPARATRMLIGSFEWTGESDYYRNVCARTPNAERVSGTAEFKITKDPLQLNDVSKSYIKFTQTGGGCPDEFRNITLPYMTNKIPLVAGTTIDEKTWEVKRLEYDGNNALPDPEGPTTGEMGFIDFMTRMGTSMSKDTLPANSKTTLVVTQGTLKTTKVPEASSILSLLILGTLVLVSTSRTPIQ